MKTAKVKRLWNNLASVRDYIVDEAIANNEDLKIVIKNKTMTIPKDKLAEARFQCHKTEFKSKFPPASKYTLYDFEWKPDAQH